MEGHSLLQNPSQLTDCRELLQMRRSRNSIWGRRGRGVEDEVGAVVGSCEVMGDSVDDSGSGKMKVDEVEETEVQQFVEMILCQQGRRIRSGRIK